MMIEIRKSESLAPLEAMKRQYLQQTTAPLDGMWLTGFVPMATHYAFYDRQNLIGFCCSNDEGYLLQFFVTPQHEREAEPLFGSIVRSKDSAIAAVKGAFVSTAEPRYLSLCLDFFPTFEVNALMYQQGPKSTRQAQDTSLPLVTIEPAQRSQAVEFAKTNISAPEDWLTDYFANLISRQELFGLWDEGRLLATGENRGYDEYQTEYADLGVIVAESERGKGLATRVLKKLIALNEARGLKSICSTEKKNIAAQKAISRAGLVACNRIVRFMA